MEIGTFQKNSDPPGGGEPLKQGLSEYFFKEADKILNPSDANFKGSDSKKLGVGIVPSTPRCGNFLERPISCFC